MNTTSVMTLTAQSYDVHFFDRRVLVTATSDPDVAHRWVQQVRAYHARRIARGRLVAGLAVAWSPGRGRDPAAALQLCVGHHCLVFQLCRCPYVPGALVNFLADARIKFVGFGAVDHVRRLGLRGLRVASAWEVRKLAVMRHGEGWGKASMEALAERVLGYGGVRKDEAIRRSEWQCPVLTPGQVMHACVDAYVAFRLGLVFLSQH